MACSDKVSENYYPKDPTPPQDGIAVSGKIDVSVEQIGDANGQAEVEIKAFGTSLIFFKQAYVDQGEEKKGVIFPQARISGTSWIKESISTSFSVEANSNILLYACEFKQQEYDCEWYNILIDVTIDSKRIDNVQEETQNVQPISSTECSIGCLTQSLCSESCIGSLGCNSNDEKIFSFGSVQLSPLKVCNGKKVGEEITLEKSYCEGDTLIEKVRCDSCLSISPIRLKCNTRCQGNTCLAGKSFSEECSINKDLTCISFKAAKEELTLELKNEHSNSLLVNRVEIEDGDCYYDTPLSVSPQNLVTVTLDNCYDIQSGDVFQSNILITYERDSNTMEAIGSLAVKVP